jgi:hypothetical protein
MPSHANKRKRHHRDTAACATGDRSHCKSKNYMDVRKNKNTMSVIWKQEQNDRYGKIEKFVKCKQVFEKLEPQKNKNYFWRESTQERVTPVNSLVNILQRIAHLETQLILFKKNQNGWLSQVTINRHNCPNNQAHTQKTFDTIRNMLPQIKNQESSTKLRTLFLASWSAPAPSSSCAQFA